MSSSSRSQKGLRWFKTTMLFVVWVPLFKAIFAFGHPDPGGKLAEALVILIGLTVMLGLPAFFLGFATWRKPHPESRAGDSNSPAADDETAIYSAISDELESGAIDKALWTRLFAQCDGDENKTKAAYIQRRAEVLAATEGVKRSRKMATQATAGGSSKATDRGAHSGMIVTSDTGTGSIHGWQWIMLAGVAAAVAAAAYAVYVVPKSVVPKQAADVREQADLHGIDASDLYPVPDDPTQLILEATISHHSAEAQNYPWLELTLTDSQDKPVARKALSPDVYLGEAQPPAFTSETKVKVSLRLDMSTLQGKKEAIGYRLYLFFPSTEPDRLAYQINADALRLVAMPTSASTGGNIFDQFDPAPAKPPKINAFGHRIPEQDELQPIQNREHSTVSPAQSDPNRTSQVR